MIDAIVRPFAIAFLLAVLLVPLCRRLAFRLDLVAHPRDDRWHRTSIPMLGGIAIGLAIFAGCFMTGIASELARLPGRRDRDLPRRARRRHPGAEAVDQARGAAGDGVGAGGI